MKRKRDCPRRPAKCDYDADLRLRVHSVFCAFVQIHRQRKGSREWAGLLWGEVLWVRIGEIHVARQAIRRSACKSASELESFTYGRNNPLRNIDVGGFKVLEAVLAQAQAQIKATAASGGKTFNMVFLGINSGAGSNGLAKPTLTGDSIGQFSNKFGLGKVDTSASGNAILIPNGNGPLSALGVPRTRIRSIPQTQSPRWFRRLVYSWMRSATATASMRLARLPQEVPTYTIRLLSLQIQVHLGHFPTSHARVIL